MLFECPDKIQKICSFRRNSSVSKEADPNQTWSIVSTVGGKITGIHAEKQYKKCFCSLEKAESYVEKFLLIKDIEQELTNLNYVYFLEFEVDKAIFWYQQLQEDSVGGIDINSS